MLRLLFICCHPGIAERAADRAGLAHRLRPLGQGREVMMGYGRYEDVVNVLDQAVSRGDFLVGQSFTAANVYVGSHLSFDRDELQEAAHVRAILAAARATSGGVARQGDHDALSP